MVTITCSFIGLSIIKQIFNLTGQGKNRRIFVTLQPALIMVEVTLENRKHNYAFKKILCKSEKGRIKEKELAERGLIALAF